MCNSALLLYGNVHSRGWQTWITISVQYILALCFPERPSWQRCSLSGKRWKAFLLLIIVQQDATQSSLFIILQVHSTCFGCQPHLSSGVHKTVNTASGTGHIFCVATSLQRCQTSLVTLEGGSCSTGGCSYSFVYSWWWVWLTPETCRVNLQSNK